MFFVPPVEFCLHDEGVWGVMSANTVSDQVDEEDGRGVYSTAGLYNYIVL